MRVLVLPTIYDRAVNHILHIEACMQTNGIWIYEIIS